MKDSKKEKQQGKKSAPAETSDQKTDLMTYLKGVKAEWYKVSWPNWPQIWGQTLVVLGTVTVMTLGIWGVDLTFGLIIDWITP